MLAIKRSAGVSPEVNVLEYQAMKAKSKKLYKMTRLKEKDIFCIGFKYHYDKLMLNI